MLRRIDEVIPPDDEVEAIPLLRERCLVHSAGGSDDNMRCSSGGSIVILYGGSIVIPFYGFVVWAPWLLLGAGGSDGDPW